MPDLSSQLKSPPFLLKWVELILAIVSIALLRDASTYPSANIDKMVVCYFTLAGYILINSIIIVGLFKGEQMGSITILLFLVCGGVLWISSGAFMIEFYDSKVFNSYANDRLLASGIISLVNGVVFLTDAFFTRRG
ncbi:uncharacterized protein [Hetaerina americana]|uniref:uncharacterized protein n=1 Tax=Hetaerina americana TaxID=62018 RepID=UPI003A7F4451